MIQTRRIDEVGGRALSLVAIPDWDRITAAITETGIILSHHPTDYEDNDV